MVVSSDPAGGQTAWKRFAVGVSSFGSLSCPSASLCAAVGADKVLVSTHPAVGSEAWWTAQVDPNGKLNDIPCASPSIGVATGGSGAVVTSTNPAGDPEAWTLTDLHDDSQSYGCAKYFTACTVQLLARAHDPKSC